MSDDDLDAKIRELCMQRFERDPEGYERFIVGLLPQVVTTEPVLTYRDIARITGVVKDEGRTSMTVVDD